MSVARQYDLIVFGATGFTGQYVAEEVARVAVKENVTWAVSGRNVGKMKTILENVKKSTGVEQMFRSCQCCSHIFMFYFKANLLKMLESSRQM